MDEDNDEDVVLLIFFAFFNISTAGDISCAHFLGAGMILDGLRVLWNWLHRIIMKVCYEHERYKFSLSYLHQPLKVFKRFCGLFQLGCGTELFG